MGALTDVGLIVIVMGILVLALPFIFNFTGLFAGTSNAPIPINVSPFSLILIGGFVILGGLVLIAVDKR